MSTGTPTTTVNPNFQVSAEVAQTIADMQALAQANLKASTAALGQAIGVVSPSTDSGQGRQEWALGGIFDADLLKMIAVFSKEKPPNWAFCAFVGAVQCVRLLRQLVPMPTTTPVPSTTPVPTTPVPEQTPVIQ